MWEDPETAQTARALFRSALESEERRQQLLELIAERVSKTLVAAHLFGVGFSATS